MVSASSLRIYVSPKIFEHFALQVGTSNWVHKLGFTPFKDGTTLAPKLADPLSFWRNGSTPSKYCIKYSWPGLTHILYYIKMSVSWNTLVRNQILSCQQVFYYIWTNALAYFVARMLLNSMANLIWWIEVLSAWRGIAADGETGFRHVWRRQRRAWRRNRRINVIGRSPLDFAPQLLSNCK